MTDQLILFFKMFFVEKLFFDWFVFLAKKNLAQKNNSLDNL